MVDDYDIRPARAEDTPRIVDLLKVCLGDGSIPRTAEFWDWKHHRNPFGESPTVLAELNGELVGVRAFMRWRWTDGTGVVESVRAVDTATHPEHRGKGIFTRLTLCLLESLRRDPVQFVFNTPNAQSRPGYLKMGWQVHERVPLAVSVRRPARVARYAWSRVRSDTPAITTPAPAESDSFHSVSQFLSSNEAAELLSDAPRKNGGCGLRTPATSEFLEWRYGSVPGLQYGVLSATGRGTAAAVIFRECRRGSLTELRVCQLLLGSDGSASALASDLIRSAATSAGADVVTAVRSTRIGARRTLIRSRLLPAPRLGPVLMVRPLAGSGDPADPERHSFERGFDLCAGDIELF